MKNDKSKNIIIGLLLIIIVILGTLVVLFATDTLSFNYNKINDNNENIKEEDNKEINETEIYDVDKYIVLEDHVFNSKVSTKKVKLQNLKDDIIQDFYKQQNEVIDSIFVSDSDIFNAEYKLKSFINNNILSIIYTIEQTNEIGTCATKMAVTNIDLKNNKIITEEELLKKVNLSYETIVNEAYENELTSWEKNNKDAGFEISYYEVTFADFRDNKSKYISEGVKKIPNIIYTYIEDDKIKYDYYVMDLSTLFHPVGKGGCSTWKTNILEDY